MSRSWWLLPGPGEFVRRVSVELREGRNVVLLLPRHLPDGLGAAVRAERFAEGEAGPWRSLPIDPGGPPPFRQIAERLLPSPPSGPLRASWLVQQESFGGQVLWLEGLTAECWPAWRDFLLEYEHSCRSCPLLDRTVFVVPLEGPPAGAPPEEDVALAVLPYRGVVEPLDQLLYVSQLVRGRAMPRFQRGVFAAVVAGLALWDPAVADLLAGFPMGQVFRAGVDLAALGQRRGWTALSEEGAASWREGMTQPFDGRDQMHSAVLACSGDGADELSRRVWAAQVGVLLPYVEERRRELLERLDGQLQGPFHFDGGLVVDDQRDLEIGQIAYQLALRGRKVPRLVHVLKQIRNSLAHLEVVSADLLEQSEVGRPL